VSTELVVPQIFHVTLSKPHSGWRNNRPINALLLGAAICTTPISIAATEILLGLALIAHISTLVLTHTRPRMAPLFWVWLVWAAIEAAIWLRAGHLAVGAGEMRHLLLITALFFLLPSIDLQGFRTVVWRGVFFTSTAGCIALIAGFVWRMIHYRREIAAAADSALYLRSGGLLHHWMIFAVVEILVFAAMLRYHAEYPEHRKWIWPAFAIHGAAILLSLTRALWAGALIVLAIHLLSRRSRWILALPAGAALLFFLAPSPVRARVTESFDPVYYSNADRMEMWRVGIRMIRAHPWTGIGPGRVESQFASYAAPGELLPAYHGHLHDNALQLAAQFGLPALAVALWFLLHLARSLRARCGAGWQPAAGWQSARSPSQVTAAPRETRFLAAAALLGLAGYLILGVTDYTYGHSLGLILGAFALFPHGRLC
jgi:O-antigen ligase